MPNFTHRLEGAEKVSFVHAGERWNADTARPSCKPSPPL